RAGVYARTHPTAGRSRSSLRGEVESWQARSPDPFDRRLHRPGLGRTRHARALERREPAGDDLPGDEDRADLLRPAERAGGDAVRLRRDRLQVPGPARPHSFPLLAELSKGTDRMILVTGGTGFVGGHVVHELRRRDLPVRCLVRDARKASRLSGWGCDLAEGDVADAAS